MTTEKKKSARGRKPTELNPQTFVQRLGARIRETREALGLSQVKAAERSKGMVTPSLWADYELGTEPRVSKFLGVCLALGKSPLELLPEEAIDLLKKGQGATSEETLAELGRAC
jgi:transcriptional regulator with XRE-family HTH domain